MKTIKDFLDILLSFEQDNSISKDLDVKGYKVTSGLHGMFHQPLKLEEVCKID